MSETVALVVDGVEVEVAAGSTLLEALRDQLGRAHAQGRLQPAGPVRVLHGAGRRCAPGRVRDPGAPGRRARGDDGRGLSPDADVWADAFCRDRRARSAGSARPGIVARLAGLRSRSPEADHAAVEQALAAPTCAGAPDGGPSSTPGCLRRTGRRARPPGRRRRRRRTWRAAGTSDVVAASPLGHGGFADDTAPPTRWSPCSTPTARWTLGESVAEARAAAGKVQGRRTTAAAATAASGSPTATGTSSLQTSWVEPGYLETDASWCRARRRPGRRPLANGGAFGGKVATPVADVARRLADEHGRAVRVLLSREDIVRLGPKRPPIAAGLRADGTGVVRVARDRRALPSGSRPCSRGVTVEEVDVPGPPTSGASGPPAGPRRWCCAPPSTARRPDGDRSSVPRKAGTRHRLDRRRRHGAGHASTPATRSTRSSCAPTASAPPTRRCRG